jgi:hypothetical protein
MVRKARSSRVHSTDHREEPLVEFNFVGHEPDLARFMVAFRRLAEKISASDRRGKWWRKMISPGEDRRG